MMRKLDNTVFYLTLADEMRQLLRLTQAQTKEFIYITTEAMNYKKNGTKDPRLDEALGDDFAVDYIRVFDIVGERK